jgi:hypothetical protein
MRKVNDRPDNSKPDPHGCFRCPVFPLVQLRFVYHAAGLFDIPDFLCRKGSMYHVLRKPGQGFPTFFSYDGFNMNRKTGMVPASHLFHKAVADAAIPLHHGKDLFFLSMIFHKKSLPTIDIANNDP